jgi:glycerol-3-phosphate O-acyltransferase / dihydroxyacetone phosphate acyltransferase
MLYALLRAIARIALRWYYRDIQVDGLDRVPMDQSLLVVVNHPNALVDALVVAIVLPRRVMITAKSSLFTNPVGGALLRATGVVPIHRPSEDGIEIRSQTSRNLGAFRTVQNALVGGQAVLVFPEGITHDAPSLAPLKVGAARMALRATKDNEVPALALLPIGLTFERKDRARSRVFVQVGEPIIMADWLAANRPNDAVALTSEIDSRLRAVTLNYATADDAARAVQLVSGIAALFNAVPAIGRIDRRLGVDIVIARRVQELRRRLPHATDAVRGRAEALVTGIDALRTQTFKRDVLIEDVEISTSLTDAIRFLIREGLLLLVGGPIALWGWLNHWLPFRWARVVAMRSVESAADPAMRMLVAGAVFVLVAYAMQTLIAALIWNPIIAAAYLITLPIAAEISVYMNDRLGRASNRARAFLLFRRNPELQQRLIAEVETLRREALAVDRAFDAGAAETRAVQS